MSKPTTSETPRHFLGAYINRMIHRAGLRKTEVAKALGYEHSNVVSMITKGQMKVPITKVPALADALGIERRTLLHMVLREYHPEMLLVLCEVEGHSLSRNELEIVSLIREISGYRDPELTETRRKFLGAVFRSSTPSPMSPCS